MDPVLSRLLLTLVIATLSACGSGGGGSDDDDGGGGVNAKPTANAGADRVVNESVVVNLTGAASSDSDGTVTGYSWTQTLGSVVAITGANTATPQFTAPSILTNNTLLSFELIVTDNDGDDSVADSVDVTVNNVPTTAEIAALGKKLFEDTNFSNPPGQSCASCHDASAGFADPDDTNPTSDGVIGGRFGTRNSPTVSYARFIPVFSSTPIGGGLFSHSGGQFLDGREPRLEEQAQQPFLNIIEMNMASRTAVITALKSASYVDDFKAIYGDNILDNINPNPAYVNISDAIAGYERSAEVSPFSSKFDDVKNGMDFFSSSEANGEAVFIASACGRCHSNQGFQPVFTNFVYENIGTPPNPAMLAIGMDSSAAPVGPGFIDNGLGAITMVATDNGKFRTPTLRNVELTAPYMHNGVFDTLDEVVDFYDSRLIVNAEVPATVPVGDEIGNLGLLPQDKIDLVAFLKTLTDR